MFLYHYGFYSQKILKSTAFRESKRGEFTFGTISNLGQVNLKNFPNLFSQHIMPGNSFICKAHTIYDLQNYTRSNQDTSLIHKPAVHVGEWVESGDLLADCSASMNGELAIGKNILVAYMPWEGYNYEDAILINERLVYDDAYTSIHIERYEIETGEGMSHSEKMTRHIPDLSEEETKHLDENGIAKVGSWIQEGAILVGKVTPINPKKQTPYQRLLYKLLDKKISSVRDSSFRAPKGMRASVINVYVQTNNNNKLNSGLNSLSNNHNTLLSNITNLTTTLDFSGTAKDVLSTKMGPKSSPSSTFSLTCLPCLPGGAKMPVEQFLIKTKKTSVLNVDFAGTEWYLPTKKVLAGTLPAQTQSSMVEQEEQTLLGQEEKQVVHIYLAEKRKIQVGDKMAGRHGNKGIISNILPRQDMPYLPDGTPIDIVLNPLGVPSRMNVGQIYECLLGLAGKYLGEHYKILPFDEIYGAEASRSFVFAKLFEASKKTGIEWLFDPNSPGKIRIFDGRTAESFDQPVTVGIAYMLKLVHMVDDKLHMRSTGPYSLVTQQPLRGRAKQGGQRLGEMEVWAIEGYGAAFVLLEMLTLKSDDMTGRLTLWSNLILNKEIYLGTPESFKVLVCELQALCLDIGLFHYNFPGKKGGEQPTTSKSNSQAYSQQITLKEISHLMLLP